MSIIEFIDQIENQTDYLFVYSKNELDTNEKISLKTGNKTLIQCLSEAFGNTKVKYIFENDYIVLTTRNISITQQLKKQITGAVTDEQGEPIIGANVVEKGTTRGIVTDVNGNFSLPVAENAILQISFIGFVTQEITIGSQTTLNIMLREDTQALEEIVVVGYGTQRKGEVASAITTITSDKFIKFPSPDASKMIRGQVPGLTVNTPDANPTSTSQLMLRGITTLRSSTSPLVLVDGIPSDLITVSPDDIEQIDVLKDGSAAAIYGTRGTNGVILITTKNAKGEMPTTVEVNMYISTQQITKKLPFMTTDQYREKAAQGKPGAFDYGGQANWLDEVLQTPLTQVYNINLRGGNKTTNYVASFDYRSMEGIIKRSDNQMIFPRIEVTHRMFDNKLKINAGLNGYLQKYFSGSDGGSYNNEVYYQALMHNPTDFIKDENGVWTERATSNYYNPLALLWETDGENKATNLRMFSNITFTPVEGLDINWSMSSNTWNQVRGYYETQKHMSTTKNGRNGYASRGGSHTLNNISELTAQYRKTLWDDHAITLLGGYSWLKTGYESFSMSNFNFPSDDYTYNSMGQGQALSGGRAGESSSRGENKLISYFGRLNYAYKGKYMLAASVRYEGSSKFGANHKWGTFPAVSAAWNIKREDFLNHMQTLSALKLRAGFGTTGTEPSNAYMSLNTLNFGNYTYANSNWIKTIRPASNANPNLRWEKKEETNIGLDFGFLNDKITGSIDFYNRETKDLLWDYSVPSPPYLFSSMIANGGSIRNRGIEIAIQAIPIKIKDFQWITNANYSTNNTTLISLSNEQFITGIYSDQGYIPGPIQTPSHRMFEGGTVGDFWGYKTIDVDDNGYWIIEGEDGNPKSIAEEQPADKKVIGNGHPKHYLNWNNSVSYKNFDLGVTMRGAFGFQILNMADMYFTIPSNIAMGNLYQRAFEPVYSKRPLADDQPIDYVDYYIEDGDYWKIDNLTLGYLFRINNKWIKQVRVYGTISNLAVITKYGGIDPEVNIGGLAPGVDDFRRYPSARTYTFGLSLNF
jgi:TonB-linked SusC/RagA family outer membrane protein